ncbi:BQ5605_C010g05890 [Microbotryum silenes-dioicae]|uniref:Golgi apparatus membrane protein TVP38 n=1 Tax=Microbotryum silenes-dioicae TaxID=796604 RepID=A0A2X0LPX8_9BASI|nr:BQ5605_C010g05890 [Microbotryum silenes-dioicae]
MSPISSLKNEASEAKEASKEVWNFTRTHNWKKSARNSFRMKYFWYWFVGIILVAFAVVVAIYRDPIVSWFEPRKHNIVNLPASWAIPVAILVVLSFPPLGGHEVVLLVVGLIWGIWIGFAIACAGTFIGELACFFAFKYFFTEKARKVEHKSIFYACLARLMRDGGVWIVAVVRFSAIPGHVVTALQSTVGMPLWRYSIAVIISLPKQLAIVYLGVMFGETKDTSNQASIDKQRRISLGVFFGTAIATVLALYIVYMRARKLYPVVMAEAEERRALAAAELGENPPRSHPHDPTLIGAAWDGESISSDLDLGKDRVFSAGPHSYVLPARGRPVNFDDPHQPTGPIGYGQSPYAPPARIPAEWTDVEARERWEAENQQQGGYNNGPPLAHYGAPHQMARVSSPRLNSYPPNSNPSMTSFTHLPLQGSDYN